MTIQVLRSRRQYAIDTLAQGNLSAGRRSHLEGQLAQMDARLGARCSDCGRHLEAADSIAAGIGPVCSHKAAA